MKKLLTFVLLAGFAAGTAFAETSSTQPVADQGVHNKHHASKNYAPPKHEAFAQGEMTDDAAIEGLLKSMFHSPDNPLSVVPIVVEGKHAVAGWSQSGRGGRAFLEKSDKGWEIVMCSGESLKSIETYIEMGMQESKAESLQMTLNTAESHLSTNVVSLLDSFEGTIMIRGNAAAHGDHQPQHGNAHHGNAQQVDHKPQTPSEHQPAGEHH